MDQKGILPVSGTGFERLEDMEIASQLRDCQLSMQELQRRSQLLQAEFQRRVDGYQLGKNKKREDGASN